MTVKDLERAAVQAHHAGVRFTRFWPSVSETVRELEPWNRQRYHRLHDRLMHLTICGDLDGQYGIGDPDAQPWLEDDAADTQAMQQLFGEVEV